MPRLTKTLPFVLALLLASPQAQAFYHVVRGGHTITVAAFYGIDPTCHSNGPVEVNVVRAPRGGRIEIASGKDYPNFPPQNPRAHCDKIKVPSTRVLYHAEVAFAGDDSFDVELIFPNGTATKARYFVSVRMASVEDAMKPQ